MERAKEAGKKLDELDVTLRLFSGLVSEKKKRLEGQIAAAQKQTGMASLSDDVLAIILEHACDDYPEEEEDLKYACANSLDLAHVSRRFRNVALSLPRLWTHVYDCMAPDEVAFFVKRSRDAGLYLVVEGIDGLVQACTSETRADAFLAALVPHAHRWREIRVKAGTAYKRPFFDIFNARCTGLHLPSLISLIVDFPADYQQSEERTGVPPALARFCESWSMPNLRHLTSVNYAPSVEIARELRSC